MQKTPFTNQLHNSQNCKEAQNMNSIFEVLVEWFPQKFFLARVLGMPLLGGGGKSLWTGVVRKDDVLFIYKEVIVYCTGLTKKIWSTCFRKFPLLKKRFYRFFLFCYMTYHWSLEPVTLIFRIKVTVNRCVHKSKQFHSTLPPRDWCSQHSLSI